MEGKNDRSRLDLPEGLSELMSDISREVLRSQPADIYGFIADYLSVLLVTRDNLSVAGQVCDNVCDCECQPELVNELENIGVDETDAQIVQEVILKHFEKEKVNEGSLLASILAKTNIEARMYPEIVNIVRAAYLRHQGHAATEYETSLGNEKDEVAMAVAHTLELYRQAGPPDDLCEEMATKIQASYRAYGVRRKLTSNNTESKASSDPDSEYAAASTGNSSTSADFKEIVTATRAGMENRRRVSTASEISLAGSINGHWMQGSYNARDIECLSMVGETDKVQTYDYIDRTPHVSLTSHDGRRLSTVADRRISFKNDHSLEMLVDQKPVVIDETNVIEKPHKDEEYYEIEDPQVDEYYNENGEDAEKSFTEEVVELDGLECGEEECEIKSVNDVDVEYINALDLEVDTDSGDD